MIEIVSEAYLEDFQNKERSVHPEISNWVQILGHASFWEPLSINRILTI